MPVNEVVRYIGVKVINAKPMTRGDYNDYRGWTIPENENPADEGYLVVYPDGYESWSPKKVFEEAYRQCDNLPFGLAIEALKKGHKLARRGWNGKGMFVYYIPANSYPASTEIAKNELADEEGLVKYNPYLAIKTVSGAVSTWVPSINDCLADDWYIVEFEEPAEPEDEK